MNPAIEYPDGTNRWYLNGVKYKNKTAFEWALHGLGELV